MNNWMQKHLNIFKSLCCLGLSIFFAIAILSYNSDDPSFNVVTSASPTNLAGNLGAYVADLILQFFDLASFLLVIFFFCWGFAFYHYRQISYWGLRIIAIIIALNAATLILTYIKLGYNGGVIGLIWKAKLSPYFSKNSIIIASSAILSISLYFSLALSSETWTNFTKNIHKIISLCFKAINFIGKKLPHSTNIQTIEAIKPKISIKTAPRFTETPTSIAKQEKFETETPIKTNSKITSAKPSKIILDKNGFILPSTDLLQDFTINKDLIAKNNSAIKQNTEELIQVLSDFGISGDLIGAYSGPVVTLYEFEPAAGTKSSRVIGLSDDIARSMRAISARIAVIPGRNAIGIEIPNKQRETVYLKELLESSQYRDSNYDLPMILGKDISGNVIIADLAKMPHLLVAGTTGSGKSVAINTMIISLLYALSPEQCKFIMVDPKMLELSVYDGIPHLLTNVVTDPTKAVVALKWVVKEMENRYRSMSNLGVRNIHNYNSRLKEAIAKGEIINRSVQTGFDPETGQPKIEQVPLNMETLPFIVVIVDEMADLMLVAGKDIETSIQRLAQMARAAGIHIIMATQRPSVDVITGVIKANFPTRISFQVTSKIDSRTILGEQGAEQLLGKGDMLYMAGGSKITRIHGPFIADNEVERIVSYLKEQGQPNYMADITTDDGSFSSGSTSDNSEVDELYKQAVEMVTREGKASTSFIQRCLKIGYNRAANIMEQMERDGLVGKPNHVGKREIFM